MGNRMSGGVEYANKLSILPIYSANSFSQKLFSCLKRLLVVAGNVAKNGNRASSRGSSGPVATNLSAAFEIHRSLAQVLLVSIKTVAAGSRERQCCLAV